MSVGNNSLLKLLLINRPKPDEICDSVCENEVLQCLIDKISQVDESNSIVDNGQQTIYWYLKLFLSQMKILIWYRICRPFLLFMAP